MHIVIVVLIITINRLCNKTKEENDKNIEHK